MGKKNHVNEEKLNFRWGCVHLSLFLGLIIAGIVVKRVYGHPEYMMAFHGPAAVFLIVGGLKITYKQRKKFLAIQVD